MDIPKELLSDKTRVLIEARNTGEPPEAVPIDRVLLWPGETRPLLLPVGSYDLIVYFEGQNEPATASVEVVEELE